MTPLDLIPVGCCTIGEDGVIVEANPLARSLLSEDNHPVEGQAFDRFVHREDRLIFLAKCAEALARAEPQTCDVRLVESPGGERWVQLHAARPSDEPETRRLRLVLVDIHEHKLKDAARFEAIRRMRSQQDALTNASLSDAFVAGDFDTLAREITELTAGATGVERAGVWVFNDDETQIRCVDLFEATPGHHTAGAVLLESQYQNEFEALKSRRFVDASDPLTDPRTSGYVEGYLKPLRITSMLDAVIEVSGRRLGLLCLEHVDRPHQWEHDEIAFACQLADKLALSLVNRARRDAQTTLRASEVRYRRLFESAKNGILILDAATGVVLDANPALASLLESSPEDLLGRRVWETPFFREILADKSSFKALVSSESRQDDTTVESRTGRKIDVEIVSNTYLVNDARVVQCNVSDISERKSAERDLRKFSRIVDQAPLSIAITDLTGAIEYVNPRFCETTGYSREETIGQNPRILKSGETPPEDYAAMWSSLRLGQVWRGEFVNRRKDGGTFVELTVIAPVVSPEGAISHYVALTEDITKRKESERDLEASLLEKQALLKEVHHRVKNNLQVISSLLRLESSRSPELETQRVLKEMQGRILSMALLHETLYRGEDFRKVDLAGYLKQLAMQFFRAQTSSTSRVRLQTEVSPAYVTIDQAIPCGLIVNELLTNCIKHGFPEGTEGEVRLVVRPGMEGQIHIEVSNSGAPLPPDFEAKRSRSLGLQLVSDLARQVGGQLEIGPGSTARFAVTLTPTARGDSARQSGEVRRKAGA